MRLGRENQKTTILFVFLSFLISGFVRADSYPVLSLDGKWRFALDPQDVGLQEQWYLQNLTEEIHLPGILQSQGFGNSISKETPWVLSLYDRFWYLRREYRKYAEGDVKVPFLSQPLRHYLGPAWYQRDV